MTWQWIEDFIVAACAEAELRRCAISLSESDAARLQWAAALPIGEA